MKTRTPITAALLAALVLAALLIAPQAAMARDKATLDIRGSLVAGEPVTAHFELVDHTMAFGAYPSINIKVLTTEDRTKQTIRPGFPDSILTFSDPGTYPVTFILNEVSKGSCGGVDAVLLFEGTREITIIAP